METFAAAHSKYRGSRIAHTDRTSNTQPHADMNNSLHAIQQAIMRQKHCQPMAMSTRRMYNCTHPMGIYLLRCPLSVHFEFARFRYYRTQRLVNAFLLYVHPPIPPVKNQRTIHFLHRPASGMRVQRYAKRFYITVLQILKKQKTPCRQAIKPKSVIKPSMSLIWVKASEESCDSKYKFDKLRNLWQNR